MKCTSIHGTTNLKHILQNTLDRLYHKLNIPNLGCTYIKRQFLDVLSLSTVPFHFQMVVALRKLLLLPLD